jgi:hypothetical protein
MLFMSADICERLLIITFFFAMFQYCYNKNVCAYYLFDICNTMSKFPRKLILL